MDEMIDTRRIDEGRDDGDEMGNETEGGMTVMVYETRAMSVLV